MDTIKAGSMSAFLKGTDGAAALFGGLFKDCAGVSVEISWGDIPAGARDVHLSVKLHKEDGACCPCADIGAEVDTGFCDDSVLNNMPVTDYDGDGLDDGFSDGKMRAWAEYLGENDSDETVPVGEEIEVDLEDDPNAYMPEQMLEDDDLVDDDDFCGDEDEV